MKRTALIRAAAAGLLTVGGWNLTTSLHAADDRCYGVNKCKGTGDCGGKGTSCAGTNSCKGEGWLKIDKNTCVKIEGGRLTEEAATPKKS